MTDYSSAIQGVVSGIKATTVSGLDQNPDEAARAVGWEKTTGVPAQVVAGDLDGFEAKQRQSMATSLVMSNPTLQAYIHSHPMAAAVSSDDWGNLHKIAEATSAFGQLHGALSGALKEGWEGAKEGFGEGPLAPVTTESLAQQYPALAPGRSLFSGPENLALTGAMNLGNILLKGTSGIFGGILGGIKGGATAVGGPQFGAALSGLAEYEMIKPEAGALKAGEAPKPAEGELPMKLEAEPPGSPWINNGDEPPAGLHPDFDKAKADINKEAASKLDEAVKAAQTSTTRERSPEMWEKFFQQYPEMRGKSIGINGDAVVALYGDKVPTPDDGLLGWVPGIEEKLANARETGGDVEVPITDWISKVDPKIAKGLADHLRVWDGGITAEEAKVPSAPTAPASDLGQVRQAGGLNPVVSPEEFANLKASGVELDQVSMDRIATSIAKQQAEDLARVQSFAEREQARRQSKEWKDNAESLHPGVEELIRTRPEVAADLFVGAGELRGEKVQQRFTLKEGDLTREQQAALPAHYVSKNGLPIDAVAHEFGFQSGDELVAALAQHTALRGELSPQQMFKRLVDQEVSRQMEAKYGRLSENILREAKDQALSEATLQLLTDEYEAAALRAKVTAVDKAAIEAHAKDVVSRLPRSMIKSDKQLALTGRHWRDAQRALIARDDAAALVAMQRRVVSAYMAKEMQRIEAEQEKFKTITDRYAKWWDATKKQSVSPSFSTFVRDILQKVGMKYGMTEAGLAKRIEESGYVNLQDFVTKQEKEGKSYGLELAVPDWMFQPKVKPITDMTVGEWREVRDAVTQLDKIGRGDQKVIEKGEKVDLANWVDRAVGQLAKYFEPIPADYKKGRLRQATTTAIAMSTSNETLMSRFDHRDPHGIFTETITKPAAARANFKAVLQREVAKRYGELGEIENAKKKLASPFVDPRTRKPWDFRRENLAAVVSNMGNPYNFAVMAKGWGLDADMLWKWIEDNTTVKDIDRAQALGHIWGWLKPQADREYLEIYELSPESVVPRPFTMHGKTYEGWYHPMIGDSQLSKYVNRMPDVEDEPSFFPATRNSYMKRRTGATQVVDLTYDMIPSRLDQTIHDIAFRGFVHNTARIFRDDKFRQGIISHYGKEAMEEMDQWLMRIAGDSSNNSGAMKLASQLSNQFRQQVISTQIAFNISTVEKHGLTAWAMSARELGPNLFKTVPQMVYYTGIVFPSLFKRAAFDLFGHSPELGDSLFDFIKGMSEEIQRRDRNYLDTMMGQQAIFKGESTWSNKMAQWGAKAVAFSDLISASALWLAKYREELETNGGNIGTAVEEANFGVRRAHGSTAVTNLPRIAANSGPVTTWMTSLYGFMGTNMQRRIEMFHDLNDMYHLGMHGEIREAAKKVPLILSSFAVYVVWTGLVEEYVTGQFFDDRRGLGQRVASALFGWAANTIIGMRDLVYDFEHGQDTVGLISTPITNARHLLRDVAKKNPLSKEHAGQLLQDACTELGDLSGRCPKHLGTIMHYGLDVFDGFQHPRKPVDVYRGLVTGHQKLHEVR